MNKSIERLRAEIGATDFHIVKNLQKRKLLVLKIAEIKKKYNSKIKDGKRENAIKEKIKKLALEKNLDVAFVMRLYGLILKNSRMEQNKSKNLRK